MSTRRTYQSTTDPSSPTTDSSAPTDRILTPTPGGPSVPSNTSPAVPTHIIVKLLTFTALMITGPLSVYFFLTSYVLSESKTSSTWAGAAAAITANVVLIGYIIVAVREDQGEQAAPATAPGQGKKGRVGKIE
ncbi:MAG: vacuolar ATPase assembly integral membrane protein vma21 [Alyxoria varia]|nr:MAG: vacuolar ATPase assembly integral membrane protein vma21 [Alyxoria varia]